MESHMRDSAPGELCLGLIGGLGVGAAIHYYKELASAHSRRGHVLQLVIVHADVERAMKHVERQEIVELADYFASLILKLSAAGAQVAVLPAITPHICAPELIERSPLPIIDIIDEVLREVHARSLRRVALFGTRASMESRLFGRLRGVEVVDSRPDELAFIHKTYVDIVNAGAGTQEQHRGLTELAHRLVKRDGVEAVLLAGTDLAVLFNESNTDFPHVDCARVHIDGIMRRLLGE